MRVLLASSATMRGIKALIAEYLAGIDPETVQLRDTEKRNLYTVYVAGQCRDKYTVKKRSGRYRFEAERRVKNV